MEFDLVREKGIRDCAYKNKLLLAEATRAKSFVALINIIIPSFQANINKPMEASRKICFFASHSINIQFTVNKLKEKLPKSSQTSKIALKLCFVCCTVMDCAWHFFVDLYGASIYNTKINFYNIQSYSKGEIYIPLKKDRRNLSNSPSIKD